MKDTKTQETVIAAAQIAATLMAANRDAFVYTEAMAVRQAIELINEAERQLENVQQENVQQEVQA